MTRYTSRAVPLLLAAALALLVGGGLWLLDRGDGRPETPSAPPEDPVVLPGIVPAPVEEPPADPPYTEEDRVRAEGLVLAADTGAAIAGARVRVGGLAGSWETRSDDRGQWALDLPPRKMMETERGPDLLTHHSVYADAPGYLPGGDTITLPREGNETQAPTLFLHRARLHLRGTVRDEDGNPVAGARCEVSFRGTDAAVAVSDAEGRFGPVPALWRDAYFFVTAEGYLITQTSVDILPGRKRDVTVDLRMLRPRWVSGRVTDEEDRPIPGARVSGGESSTVVFSDGDGRFRWPIAPFASEVLYAEKEGYAALEYLGAAAGAETTIVLRRAARVEGRLLTFDDRPAADVEIEYRSDAGGWGRATTTDAEGRFVLDPVLPGTVTLSVSRAELTFEVAEPGPMTGLTLRLPELDTVACLVTDAVTGAPVEGAAVYAGWHGESKPVAFSDADGRFTVHLPPGKGGLFGLLRDGYHLGDARVRLEDMKVPAEATLDPLTTIRLRTVDDDGRPIPGVRVKAGRRLEFHGDHEGVAVGRVPVTATRKLVIVHPARRGRQIQVAPVPGETLDLGDVVLSPREGTVEIRVVAEGGKPVPGAVVLPSGGGEPIVADDAGRALVPKAKSYRIFAPGRERGKIQAPGPDGATVTLRRGAPFCGRVIGPDGKGVPGVEVLCTVPVAGPPTDAEGRFELDGAAAGTAGILSIYPNELSGMICEVWAVAGEEVVLRHPGLATIVVPEEEGDWLMDVMVTSPDQEDLGDGGALKMDPKYASLPSEVRIPVPAGRVILSYRMEGGALVHHHLRLEPGEVARVEHPEGDPPTIAVLPAAGLAEEGIDYDVFLVSPDAALGDFSPDSDYRNPEPVWYLGPPVRLRVADLQYATYYTAPLDLREGATITVPLSEPGEVMCLLTDAAGKPVEGARARLRAPFGFRHWEWDESDESGEAYLGCDLPIGPQTVEVRLPGRLPVLRRIDIGPGRLTEMEILLD